MKVSKNELKKVIVSKCVECCGFERSEAKICGIKNCPLWSVSRMFFGIEVEGAEVEKKERKTRKPMSDEHKAKLAAGRESARANKVK